MDELPAITKIYDILLWLIQRTSKFPKNQRYLIGERLENNGLDILEYLIEARFSKNKFQKIQDADSKIQILRYLIRMTKDLKLLQENQYIYIIKEIDELGRMIGAWKKNIEQRKN